MYKVLIILISLMLLIVIGCSRKPKDIYLTQDALDNLNAANITEICVITPRIVGMLPYSYEFPIRDPKKINIFLKCMQDATQITESQRPERPVRPVIFKSRKVWYGTNIGWNDEVVYGDWNWPTYSGYWVSSELREYFRQWNLIEEITAADPNLPAVYWQDNPQSKLPWMRIEELRVGHFEMGPVKEFTRDTLAILDFSKVRDVCIVVNESQENMQVFPIETPQKIETFLTCMKAADEASDENRISAVVYFVVEDMLFVTGIGWDDRKVYGNWWESEQLRNKLNEWNFEDVLNADLNWAGEQIRRQRQAK